MNGLGNMTQADAMAAGGAFAVFAAAYGVALLISLVWCVLVIIANWKIYTKAGEKGWKSIIPYYNLYTEYKFSWKTKFFWILIAILAVVFVCYAVEMGIVISAAMQSTNELAIMAIIPAVLMYICMIPMIIIQIIQTHKLSKAFGHGAGFTVGLIFLQPIFRLILGFGNSQYIGNTSNK